VVLSVLPECGLCKAGQELCLSDAVSLISGAEDTLGEDWWHKQGAGVSTAVLV
jgi:hypothetical protein